MNKKYFLIIFLALIFPTVSAVVISNCGTNITASGDYELNQDISINGTCIAVRANDVNLDCKGFTISYSTGGAVGANGINASDSTAHTNLTIQNCIIRKSSIAGSLGWGILLSNYSNSLIINNTIITNGTSDNYGIYLRLNATQNIIRQNTITTRGTGANNYGIFLNTTYNANTLDYNTISTNGTTTNYGVYILGNANWSANENILYSNTITTNGAGASNFGMYLTSNANTNNITNNTIFANGTTLNYGIHLLGTTTTPVNNNTIIGNTITTAGSGISNHGIFISANTSSNLLRSNTLFLNSTSTTNYGIYVLGIAGGWANNNNIESNIVLIRSNASSTGNNAIRLSTNVNNNSIIENNVTVNGTSGLQGITLIGTAALSADNNTLSRNVIGLVGSAGSNWGIHLNLNSNGNNIIDNNITTAGTTLNYGIHLLGTTAGRVTNNIIYNNNITTSGSGISNHGIFLSTNTTNNNITYNNILSNGTNTNYAIYLLGAAGGNVDNNLVDSNRVVVLGNLSASNANIGIFGSTNVNNNSFTNNTLTVFGATSTNYGVQLLSTAAIPSNNNYISSNQIIVRSNVSGVGILLSTNTNANRVQYNTIRVNGTTPNYGVQILGTTAIGTGFNNVTNNNITVNTTGASNFGIYILTNAGDNNITGNAIEVTGTTLNNGIHLLGTTATVDENFISLNSIQVKASGASNKGIYLLNSANDNHLLENALDVNGTTTNFGILLGASVANEIKSNTIKTNGTTASNTALQLTAASINNILYNNTVTSALGNGIQFVFSANSPNNNIMRENTLNNASYFSLNVSSIEINDLQFINQPIDNYTIGGEGIKRVTIENTLYGKIYFPLQINNSGTNLSSDIQIGNNSIFINESKTGLNRTAVLTFYNLPAYQSPIVYRNGVKCLAPLCNNASFIGNNSYRLNITSGGIYALSEVDVNASLNYPINNSYFTNNTVTLNYTAYSYNSNTGNLTVWLYGNGNLLNISYNITNNTENTYTWTDIPVGLNNWSVTVGDSSESKFNMTTTPYYFNIINLTIYCNAGGPYTENAQVLVNGNISDGFSNLSNQLINITLYKEGVFNRSQNTTTSAGGTFDSSFTSLTEGNYTLNASVNYQGYNASCVDSFTVSVGGGTEAAASLVLDKIVSLSEVNPTNISYNITLRATNRGGSSATATTLTDSDSTASPYIIGTIDAGATSQISYTKLYQRNSTTYNTTLARATINGTDSLTTTEISGNSTQTNLIIPATAVDANLTLIKNADLLSENTTSATYNITDSFINSGGTDLIGITIRDADIALDSSINLNRTQVYTLSAIKILNKTAQGQEYTFLRANATHGAAFYQSNQISLSLGGLETNASLLLSKTSSLYASNNTAITYNISLVITNNGGRNVTLTNITDANSANSPYSIGTLTPTEVQQRSYLATYNRTSNSYNQSLTLAFANGTDTLNANPVSAISSPISVLVPGLETNASLSLNKVASIYQSTNTNITYNITLTLTNIGGRNVTLVNVTDSDSPLSPYSFGTIVPAEAQRRSYLKVYNKSDSPHQQTLASSWANGTDYLTLANITAVTFTLNISIPARESNASLVLSKSASTHTLNATHITYNITLTLTNAGDVNATGAFIYDTNSSASPYNIGNLTTGESQQRSYLIGLPRSSQILTYTLSLATANATDSLSQNVIQVSSNQIQVVTPATIGAAALMLDKIVSLHNITNDSISYNITLKLTNKGASNTSSSNITDTDSNDSPYSIGTIDALQTISRSYIKSYTRNATTYQVGLALARSQGIDSLTSTIIDANSSQINITVPSTQEGQQITLIKNAYFNNENTTTVNYTISLQVINSGGVNLNSITLLDSDIGLNTLIDLNTTTLYNYSSSLILEKEATNREQLFVKSTATVNTITYESNQIRISIPGYGGPADTIVYAPEFVNASTSFDTIISIINQNPDIGQNFIIDYWITNTSENVNYSAGQQTIYVPSLGNTNLTATLMAPARNGSYRIRALVNYVGGPDLAFDTFEVIGGNNSEESAPSNTTSSTGSDGERSITARATQDIVCNVPYIRYAAGCCLDTNANGRCDTDETNEANEQDRNNNEGIPDESSTLDEDDSGLRENLAAFLARAKDNKEYILIGAVLLSTALVGVYVYHLYKRRNHMSIKDSLSLGKTRGMKVYSENGNYIGKIKEIYLEDHNSKIYGWLIGLRKDMWKRVSNKQVLIKQKHVRSIKNIMLIDKEVHEHLEQYQEEIKEK